jgi:hypothetical protein
MSCLSRSASPSLGPCRSFSAWRCSRPLRKRPPSRTSSSSWAMISATGTSGPKSRPDGRSHAQHRSHRPRGRDLHRRRRPAILHRRPGRVCPRQSGSTSSVGSCSATSPLQTVTDVQRWSATAETQLATTAKGHQTLQSRAGQATPKCSKYNNQRLNISEPSNPKTLPHSVNNIGLTWHAVSGEDRVQKESAAGGQDNWGNDRCAFLLGGFVQRSRCFAFGLGARPPPLQQISPHLRLSRTRSNSPSRCRPGGRSASRLTSGRPR